MAVGIQLLDRFRLLKCELESLVSSLSLNDRASSFVSLASLNRACEILAVLKELRGVHESVVANDLPLMVNTSRIERSVAERPAKELHVVSLFVDNLPINFSNSRLKRLFSKFGGVVDAYIPAKIGKNGRKFGFVRFANRDEGRKAIEGMNFSIVDKRKIFVSWAKFNKNHAAMPPDAVKFVQKWVPKKISDGHYLNDVHFSSPGSEASNGLRNLGKDDTIVPNSFEDLDCDGSGAASSKTITDPIDGVDNSKHVSRLTYRDVLLSGSKINQIEKKDQETNSDSERTHSIPLGSFDDVDERDLCVDIEDSILETRKGKVRSKTKQNMLMKSKWQLVKEATCRAVIGKKDGQKAMKNRRANNLEDDILDDINAEVERRKRIIAKDIGVRFLDDSPKSS